MSTLDLSYVVPVKSRVEILQKFVAFSEYMNFINSLDTSPLDYFKIKENCKISKSFNHKMTFLLFKGLVGDEWIINLIHTTQKF